MASSNPLKRAAHDLLVAVQFLTRIPVRVESDLSGLRAATTWFPVVGALVAGIAFVVRAALDGVAGPLAASVAAVAAGVVATGAFHEDGLADSADGLWGGWTPERRVEIMRDSRIGTYGSAALFLSLLYAVALLAQLDVADAGAALLVGHVVGRSAGIVLAATLVPAADQGLGAQVVGTARPAPLVMSALCSVAACAIAVGVWFWLPLVVAAGMVLVVRRLAVTKIDGLNGDMLGAVTQLAMLASMTAVVGLLT